MEIVAVDEVVSRDKETGDSGGGGEEEGGRVRQGIEREGHGEHIQEFRQGLRHEFREWGEIGKKGTVVLSVSV